MKKVYVGLSGGVDSAVSAALLKESGYGVTGVFIKIWQPEFLECTWREDRLDAMRVAAALSIPFREIDLSEEYKKSVIEDMIGNYKRGVTPNPDIVCNRKIKFGAFMTWARKEGALIVATGHYARVGGVQGARTLLRGVDASKDQSYFLAQLTSEDLETIIFPVGGYTKSEIRRLAQKFNLPVANKPDSQGLCFVGDITMHEFLSRYITLTRGKVVDEQGQEIGEHEGALLYTIGQRHGFSLKKSSKEPVYVIDSNTKSNVIMVSANRELAARTAFTLENVSWIGKMPKLPIDATAQVRYREVPRSVAVSMSGSKVHAHFSEPCIAAPGQTIVIYEGDKVLGCGVILKEVR